MKPSYKFYRGCYHFARAAIGIIYPLRVAGNENIPEGGALICANHSSDLDPFFVAFAFGIDNQMHIIAKVELFKIPGLSQILRKLGMISVDRGMLDISTIKATYRYFDKNEKVVIFPEGTRISEEAAHDDGVSSAKSGAIKLAERRGVPIIPVFVPRKKPAFKRVHIVIGKPYYIEKREAKRTADEYERLSADMMARIEELGVK